jgi:hypothetical protein
MVPTTPITLLALNEVFYETEENFLDPSFYVEVFCSFQR